MGVSAGVFMPLMRWLAGPRRIVVNVDGLEARRSKWKGLPRAFLRLSERLAIRHAHQVVSDNQGIADIVSILMAAAAPSSPMETTMCCSSNQRRCRVFCSIALAWNRRIPTVARIEPGKPDCRNDGGGLGRGSSATIVVGNFSTTALG